MHRFLLSLLLLFGCIAQTACAAADQAPRPALAVAAAPDDLQYKLAPGDKVRVIVFGEDTLTGEYVITSGGNLTFPLVGNLSATDKTVEQMQDSLIAALADGYVLNPKVSIQVLSFRPFYILGEVNRPGEYPVTTGLTFEQAVASAGGYTYRANTKKAFLKRATDTAERPVDLRGPEPIVIRAGDTIRIRERHF